MQVKWHKYRQHSVYQLSRNHNPRTVTDLKLLVNDLLPTGKSVPVGKVTGLVFQLSNISPPSMKWEDSLPCP